MISMYGGCPNGTNRWKQRGDGVFALSKAVMNYVTFLYNSDT
jgi:hypothetical protein